MNRPWEAFCKLGIVHFMIYPEVMGGEGPILETARKIAEDDFFEVMEIAPVKDTEVLKDLKALAESAHMLIGFGAQPGLLRNKLNLAALDEGERAKAVENVKSSIDQAYMVGARILALLDGPNSYPGEDRVEQAKDAVVKSLSELCQYAKDKAKANGYTLYVSVENFDQDIEKKSLLGPTAVAAEVVGRVKQEHQNIGLTVDLSHLPLLRESAERALSAAAEHLIHIHIGNAIMRDKQQEGYGDQHPGFGVPGSENDVPELIEYLKALFKIGYFSKKLPTPMPVVTFEAKPLSHETPEVVMANLKRTWREAWAKLEV
ncbi:MAG: TIM barrel protein [Anaerolineae bacterium]|nr:TIM barrel protein [Anaerolineae bacterium]